MTVTITARVCSTCGTPERREIVDNFERTNICPITGQCIDCLIEMTREFLPKKPVEPRPFDARAAAANDRDDR